MRWLPNLLTLVRLALIPVVVRSLLHGDYRLALGVFFAASLTDGIDGYLARRFRWTSRLGAYLDPVADKALMGAIYITLALIGAVPFWLVALIFGRDALILLFALSALAFTRLRSFPPSFWGKLSTFLQVLTAVVVMVTLAFPEWPVAWLRPAMFGAAAVGTSWSGLDYFRRGYLMLRQRRG